MLRPATGSEIIHCHQDEIPKLPSDKELTKNAKSVLAPCLSQVVDKYPELIKLIEAWPKLSDKKRWEVIGMVK